MKEIRRKKKTNKIKNIKISKSFELSQLNTEKNMFSQFLVQISTQLEDLQLVLNYFGYFI